MDVLSFVKKYNDDFISLVSKFEASDAQGNALKFDEAILKSVELVKKVQADNKKAMMIGNGGSAGITSHMAIDFWKNGKIKATAFNDSSLLTCLANDYAYEEVFVKPIEMFGEPGDMLLAISSSGNSANIVKASDAANAKGINVITFSGFSTDNKLRKKGVINFYVPAFSYGYVEVLHNYIIHMILDAKMYCTDNIDIFNKNQPL
jgi:D-sedoheptulose 7-phosphate isomerase